MKSPEQVAGAEQADQTDHDQIQRDDQIQKTRHDQNQNSGDQRNQRSQAQVNIHGGFPFSGYWIEWSRVDFITAAVPGMRERAVKPGSQCIAIAMREHA